MRIRRTLVLGCSLAALISGCSAPAGVRSRFATTFSLDAVIKKSYSPTGESPRNYSVDGSSSTVSGAVYRRNDFATFDLPSSAEPQFTLNLKNQIESAITKSGGRVTGGSVGTYNCTIEYAESSVSGQVDVIWVQSKDETFKLALMLTER